MAEKKDALGEIHRLRPKNLQMSQVKGWGYSGQKGLESKRSNKATGDIHQWHTKVAEIKLQMSQTRAGLVG